MNAQYSWQKDPTSEQMVFNLIFDGNGNPVAEWICTTPIDLAIYQQYVGIYRPEENLIEVASEDNCQLFVLFYNTGKI